jgi:hypothetical protein
MQAISIEKLSDMKNFFDKKYLNPMKCDLSFMKCNLFIYFVIGAILLFSVLLLMFTSNYSGIGLLTSTICLCIIFMVCSLILLNLCVSDAPGLFSYITIGVSLLLTLVIVLWFRKNKPVQQ